MKYDFDKQVDRTGSDDIKHEALQTIWGRTDLLPLWVADMDFETPSFITEALKKRLEHSLFGYTKEPDDLWPSVIDWVRDHHQWELKPEWLTYIPGIVKGIRKSDSPTPCVSSFLPDSGRESQDGGEKSTEEVGEWLL